MYIDFHLISYLISHMSLLANLACVSYAMWLAGTHYNYTHMSFNTCIAVVTMARRLVLSFVWHPRGTSTCQMRQSGLLK